MWHGFISTLQPVIEKFSWNFVSLFWYFHWISLLLWKPRFIRREKWTVFHIFPRTQTDSDLLPLLYFKIPCFTKPALKPLKLPAYYCFACLNLMPLKAAHCADKLKGMKGLWCADNDYLLIRESGVSMQTHERSPPEDITALLLDYSDLKSISNLWRCS